MNDYTDEDVRETVRCACRLFGALGMTRHELIMQRVESMAEILLREGLTEGFRPESAEVIPIELAQKSRRIATGDD